MKLYSRLIPADWQKELKDQVQNESDSDWRLADICNAVIGNFTVRKDEFPHIFVGEVWQALAHYRGKSPRYLRLIAEVGRAFPAEDRFIPFPFGYYKATLPLPPEDRRLAMEFLTEFVLNKYNNNPYCLTPSADKFIWLYRKHIMGMVLETQDVNNFDPDMEELETGTSIFQDILRFGVDMRTRLQDYGHLASVERLTKSLAEVMDLLPEVMRDIGLEVPNYERETD